MPIVGCCRFFQNLLQYHIDARSSVATLGGIEAMVIVDVMKKFPARVAVQCNGGGWCTSAHIRRQI